MSIKYKNNQKAIQARSEDAASYRILGVFLLAILGVFMLIFLRSHIAAGGTATIGFLWFVLFLGAAGLLFGILCSLNLFKIKAINLRWSLIIATAGFVIGLSAFLLLRNGQSVIPALCVTYPILAVLHLIYCIYQKEFFLMSVLDVSAFLAIYLYFSSPYFSAGVIIFAALALILAIFSFIVSIIGRSNNGFITVGDKKIRFFTRKALYFPLFVMCAINVIAIAATFIFGFVAAYVAMYIIAACFLISAVLYTVKLM